MVNIKELVHGYLDNLQINSVLDLGCGKGFKSLRFAKRDINVLGIDKRDFGITQECFEFKQEDINKFKFKDQYDLIISSMVLHFFNKERAIKIIKEIKLNTNNKGYNFLICMSNLDDCSKEKPENFYPDLDLIKELYSDWKIIKFDEEFTDYHEHGEKKHRHHLIIILVQKEN
jgi:SAM-dependent methyltransferase